MDNNLIGQKNMQPGNMSSSASVMNKPQSQMQTQQKTMQSGSNAPDKGTQQMQVVDEGKKPKKWMWWVIGILVLVILGVGYYYFF